MKILGHHVQHILESLSEAECKELRSMLDKRSRPPEPDVLTVDEAADLFRINRKTLYDAIARNEVPGVIRLGRVYRLSRQALVAWLQEGRVQPS